MSTLQYLTMHPTHPQPRLIAQAAEAVQKGGVIAYPTDSTYAIGCLLTNRDATTRLRQLRGLKENHPLTLICDSISQVSHYCHLDNKAFAIFKQHTPGPYTFILPATNEVPKLAQGVKRKVVGIRIPNHPVPLALIAALGSPLLSTTFWLENEDSPECDPQEMMKKTRGKINLILDCGVGSDNPSTVIDLVGPSPVLVRQGLGNADWI